MKFLSAQPLFNYVKKHNSIKAFKNFNRLVWFGLFGFLTSSAISRTGPKTERLTILRAVTHETEWEDHGFCLSRSHYTNRLESPKR